MKQRISYLSTVIFLLLIISCNDTKKGIEGDNNDNNQIIITESGVTIMNEKNYHKIKSTMIHKKVKMSYYENNKPPFIEMEYSIPNIETGNRELDYEIQKIIIKEILSSTQEPYSYDPNAIQDAIELEIKNVFRDYQSTFSDGIDGDPTRFSYQWKYVTDADVVFNDIDVISLYVLYEVYTGGAHEMYNYVGYTFDLQQNAKLLHLQDLIAHNKLNGFSKKLTDNFLEQTNKSQSDNFNSSENWYETFEKIIDDAYTSNRNIFFVKKNGLHFVLAPYEIGSFSEGHQPIFISFKDLEPFLNENHPFDRFY